MECVTLGISCDGSALSKHLIPNFSCSFLARTESVVNKETVVWWSIRFKIMKTFCFHSLLGLEEVQFVLRSCSKSPRVSSSSLFYRMYLILFGIHTFLPTLHQLHRFCVSLSKALQFLPFLLRYTRCLPHIDF